MTNVEIGICDLCGQEMLKTADDAWHPWNVERECPPTPAMTDFDGWREFNAKGLRIGRPGAQHFVEVGREA